MESTIYKTRIDIFVPTSQTVKFSYENGEAGEQLWENIQNGRLTGNKYTKREILRLNPEVVVIEVASV